MSRKIEYWHKQVLKCIEDRSGSYDPGISTLFAGLRAFQSQFGGTPGVGQIEIISWGFSVSITGAAVDYLPLVFGDFERQEEMKI